MRITFGLTGLQKQLMAVFAQRPARELLLGCAYLLSAAASVTLTRVTADVALVWPANALAAAVLIRLPEVRWFRIACILFSAGIAANVIAGHSSWTLASLFSCINLIEVIVLAVVFRVAIRFSYPEITIAQAGVLTALFGILIPGLMALPGGWVMHWAFGTAWWPSVLEWWSSDTIGACLIGPPIILFSSKGARRLAHHAYLAQNVLTCIICVLSCYLAIRYIRFPFVAIGVPLLIAAFQLGGFGTSVLSSCVGLCIIVMWALGIRPVGLESAGHLTSLVVLPTIALLATVVPPVAVGLGTDARRKVARALRASERRFRESMDRSAIGMLISNLDGVWIYTNQTLQRMLGYTSEEFRALPPGGPSTEEDWKSTQARLRKLFSGEVPSYEVERRFRHNDGHWIWTHVAVSLVRDDEGAPLHLTVQIESLEARRRAEERLAEERERFKATLLAISDAVITTDTHGRINYLNRAAESLLGLELSMVEARRLDEIIYLTEPHSSKPAANLIAQSVVHGQVCRREGACLLHRPDGTVHPISDVVSPVLDSQGLVTGTVVVLRDASAEFEQVRELNHRACHDALTGLANRMEFQQRLRRVFQRARHVEVPAAVLAIDLDHFKAVNDAGGHAAGDALLREVAEIFRANLRVADTVARLGGDEFAIILASYSPQQAAAIAAQILQTLNPLTLTWKGASYRVGASMGMACITTSMESEHDWLAAADGACYQGKREGRGQLRVANMSAQSTAVISGST
jgi:diguanylate cyclase (GGDEF)-like protein/PAS domain S-box-containing protein